MQPMKVRFGVALFAYSGNGGVASTIPELSFWLARAFHWLKTDPRIEDVIFDKRKSIYCDTPITMTRNRAVRDAKAMGCDMLLMLDSDNEPDGYFGLHPEVTPFLPTAFNFAYDRLVKKKPTVIAAPYCGPPPHPTDKPIAYSHGDMTFEKVYGGEVPYLFQWSNNESDNPHASSRIDILTRNEAARLTGIYPVAALPTGVCLFTLNAFDGLPQPYFKYEINEDGSEKMSTEDVVATRDISLYWKTKTGDDVLYATCDSWALHHKTKKVGRPQFVPVDAIASDLAEAIRKNQSGHEALEYVDYSEAVPLPDRGQVLSHDQNFVRISPEQMETARILLERELATGSEIADIQSIAVDVGDDNVNRNTSKEQSQDEPQEAQEAAAHIDPDYRKNGHALKHKMIGGHKVAIINDWELSDETVENLVALTGWLVEKKGGPLDVAVVHCGSGQGTAALLNQLPEGSHLYALDGTSSYRYSPAYAYQFSKTFQRELETGRVMAQITSRKFPWPETKQHLDLVFVERFCTKDKIKKWNEHVTLGGVIAGLGDAPEFSQVAGEVWALPVSGAKARA